MDADLGLLCVIVILFFGAFAGGYIAGEAQSWESIRFWKRRADIAAINKLLSNKRSLKRIADDLELQVDGGDSPQSFLAYCLERESRYLGEALTKATAKSEVE